MGLPKQKLLIYKKQRCKQPCACAAGPGKRSLSLTEGLETNGFAVPNTVAAAGQVKNPNATLREEAESDNSTNHVSKVAHIDGKQDSDVPTSASKDAIQRGMPAVGIEAADHSALSHAMDSSANAGMTEHEERESTSAGAAQHAQHDTARPPWSCLKAACTAQQLKALHQCCCTVACFDIFEQTSGATDQTQGNKPQHERSVTGDQWLKSPTQLPAQTRHHTHRSSSSSKVSLSSARGHSQLPFEDVSKHGRSKQGCEKQPQLHQACKARHLWSHPVIAAAYLSAGDGAVAVACSDGMLLLLDQASGNLIR